MKPREPGFPARTFYYSGWFRDCPHVKAHFFVDAGAICGHQGFAPVAERRPEPEAHWRVCRKCHAKTKDDQ